LKWDRNSEGKSESLFTSISDEGLYRFAIYDCSEMLISRGGAGTLPLGREHPVSINAKQASRAGFLP
jgi:hypothetical protein